MVFILVNSEKEIIYNMLVMYISVCWFILFERLLLIKLVNIEIMVVLVSIKLIFVVDKVNFLYKIIVRNGYIM